MPAKLRLLSITTCAALLFGFSALPAAAITLTVGGGQVDVGFACLSNAGSCSASADFDLTASSLASGTITLGGMGLTTAAIALSLPMTHMQGSSGGVTDIEFANLLLEGSLPVFVTGDLASIFQVIPTGAGTGLLSGTYDQFDGNGPALLSSVLAQLANLSCVLGTGFGQCGVQIGRNDFDLDVGGRSHDFVWIADLSVSQVPEPGTGLLVCLGLVGLAISGRQREF